MQTVIRRANGWYDFQGIDQGARYIKVHGLRSLTDRKALNTAKKLLPDNLKDDKIQIIEETEAQTVRRTGRF